MALMMFVKSFAAVKNVRSEMYAYNLVNCVTNNSNKYVSQFWKFYRGQGLQKKKFGYPGMIKDRKSTVDYFRFTDLNSNCPNLNASSVDFPGQTIPFENDLEVSILPSIFFSLDPVK
jgi:hypothetical protein